MLTLTSHLFSPAFGVYYLESNTRLCDHFGLLISTSYFSLDDGNWQLRTGKLGLGASYHLQGQALRGYYLEVYTELLFISQHHEPSRATAPLVLGGSGSAVFGYRFVWSFGLVLDVGIGLVGLHFPGAVAMDDGAAIRNAPQTRWYPNPKLNAGWSF